MPQIKYLEPPDFRTDPEGFMMWAFNIHHISLGIGEGTKGVLDSENIPGLAGDTSIAPHISDTTIHFTQGAISITESQISDLGSYEPADPAIQTHLADDTIHFTKTKGEYHINMLSSLVTI